MASWFRRRGPPQPGTVVLELGGAYLRAVKVSEVGGSPSIASAASLVGVAPREALARLARDAWFETGRVRVMLGARQRDTAILPRPEVGDGELLEAMRWQVAEKLPYPPDEAVLDVLTIDDHEPVVRQQVIVFAAHRPALAALLAPVARLRGVQIECVDVVDCAQRNLAQAACGPHACVACLTESDGVVLFTVSRGRDLVYSRAIEATGDGRDGEIAAERMGLQLQRAIDTIERRSPESAPVRILVGPATSDEAMLRALVAQCGLPSVELDWAAGVSVESTARVDIEADPALALLVGAALRRAPREVAIA